ncbi:hypothetical protein G3I38_11515 [Streptomyces sp. SID7958]|uniref:Uncharacterized protein n=2 Tax=unclassified Streptomyces TaxID=2593676 RepID=A0A6G3QQ06_9ACTN|nr:MULTISPECIES: hypothetical protein [unclassified Streptomyces]NEA85578.1 hypothetical protein [Streptomyces sp. SID14436]NEC79854.1 hypothetical protein [Streptomyces sp. SID7958]
MGHISRICLRARTSTHESFNIGLRGRCGRPLILAGARASFRYIESKAKTVNECIAWGADPWAEGDPMRVVWVVVVILIPLIVGGYVTPELALQVLSLLLALLHSER